MIFVDRSMKIALIKAVGDHISHQRQLIYIRTKNSQTIEKSPVIILVDVVPSHKSSHRGSKVIHGQFPKMFPQSLNPSMQNVTCHFLFLFVCNWLKFRLKKLKLCGVFFCGLFFSDFICFLTRKLWGRTWMLPSVLLVTCRQGEAVIDADSQAGCDLLSTAGFSSQLLAICYKSIHSFISKYPWCLLMLLPLNACNKHWQFWPMWRF